MTPTRTALAALSAAVFATLAVLAGCASDPPVAGHQGPSLAEQQQAPVAPSLAGYSVTIPKLGVSSSLTPLGLNPDRTIQVPPLSDVRQMGLYQPPGGAPKPGELGPAVILAHVNGGGKPGAFARLAELRAGDRVDVATPQGPRRFVVKRTALVPKDRFPTGQVYSDTANPQLRLISCGGEYDATHRNYLSNVIVFAEAET